MAKYPIFLELGGRRVVVIGAGPVAVRKAWTLLNAGARVVIVAEEVEHLLSELPVSSDVELVKSKYSKQYLTGAAIVIAATNKPDINSKIYKDCQRLEILCNIVDDPQHCDFHIPAVVKRGDLQIAIATEGNCPAYAGHIRKKLEDIITERHGDFLAELEKIRKKILEDVQDPDVRKAILGKLVDDESFDYFLQNGSAAMHNRAPKHHPTIEFIVPLGS